MACGRAYEAEGGVYFDSAAHGRTGGLVPSTPDPDGEPSRGRRSHSDFALWKHTDAEDEASWSSPWGMGRPGW